MDDRIKREVNIAAEDLLGGQAAKIVTSHRAKHILSSLATKIINLTQSDILLSLKTVQDVAEVYQVTPRRIRAIAKARRERGFSIGWQVPGTNQWLFLPGEVEQLKPGERGKSWPTSR